MLTYTDSGQLTCVLCKSVVRSEAVWTVHINTKAHKENVLAAKKLQEAVKNTETAPKRPHSPQLDEPIKKVKGILKNSTSVVKGVPDNFFDLGVKSEVRNVEFSKTVAENIQKTNVEEAKNLGNDDLPEGFFDDPKLDAKVMNIFII